MLAMMEMIMTEWPQNWPLGGHWSEAKQREGGKGRGNDDDDDGYYNL